MREKSPIPPILVLVVGIVAVSFSAIFIKWSSAPASVIGMYRLVFTIILIVPFLFKRTDELRVVTLKEWGMLSLSGLFLGLHFLLWIGSLSYTSVASSTILLTLQPVFVMVGAFFIFREKTTMKAIISMLIAIIGTTLIGWGDVGLSSSALFGDLLSVLGTLAVSGYMLIGQNLRARMSSLVYSFIVFMFAAGVLFIYNVTFRHPLLSYPAKEWGLFVLLAAIPTVFGHFLFNWLLRYVNATTISMSILGEPVGATFLAYFLLEENVTFYQVVGGFFAIVGVWLFLRMSHVSHNETTVQ